VDHIDFPSLGTGWTGGGPDPSSPYTATYTFDSSAVAPGAGQDVTVVDTFAGTSMPSAFTVTADSSAPTTSIACDAVACSAGWYTGPVNVTLSAVDGGSGVAQIKYTTDGTDPSPVNGTVYSGAFAQASTATVKFRTYDQVGNEEAVGSQLVRIDSAPPTGNVTAPASGATVVGSVNVSSNSADAGGSALASATFEFSVSGSGIWTTIGAADTTAPYGVVWNTTGLAPGPYDLRVTASDGAGNSSTSATVTVHVPLPLIFTAGKPKVTAKGTRATIAVPVKSSVPTSIKATLYRGKKVIFRWKTKAKVGAGSGKVKLVLAKKKLTKGKDTLVLVATSADTQHVQRKIIVKVPLRL
jgi:hypothetical protein